MTGRAKSLRSRRTKVAPERLELMVYMQPPRSVWRIDFCYPYPVSTALMVEAAKCYDSRNERLSHQLRKLQRTNAQRAAILSQLWVSPGRRPG